MTEVALGKTYNETCDSFSFAILAWQMWEMATPYEGFNVSMFEKKVIKGGARPKVNESWGVQIVDLLKDCFVDNPKRPSMSDVTETLRDEINKLSDEEISDILDASRKSQMSAHG
jgi:hypothetical protein